MDNTLNNKLEQAYNLIEANRIDDARNLLEPLLETYPEDLDLLWVYAHSVDDPTVARKTLERITEIDSSFTDAKVLLQELEVPSDEQSALPKPTIKRLQPLNPATPPPPTLPISTNVDAFNYEDDFEDDDFEELEDEKRPSRLWAIISVIALFAVILGIVLILALNNRANDPTVGLSPTATETIASTATSGLLPAPTGGATISASSANATDIDNTEDATVSPTTTDTPTATSTATDAPPTATDEPSPTPTPDAVSVVRLALADFDLGDIPIQQEETDLGETIIATTCIDTVDNRNGALSEAFAALVDLDDTNTIVGVDAIAISLTNCDLEQSIRTVGVPTDVLVDFINGAIDEEAFQLSWQPLN